MQIQWGWGQDSAFLRCFQMTPTLRVHGLHFQQQVSTLLSGRIQGSLNLASDYIQAQTLHFSQTNPLRLTKILFKVQIIIILTFIEYLCASTVPNTYMHYLI